MKINNKILVFVLIILILVGTFTGILSSDKNFGVQGKSEVPLLEKHGYNEPYGGNFFIASETHESNAIDPEIYNEPIKLYKCAQILYVTEETVYNREIGEYTQDTYTRYYDSMINLDEMTESSIDCTEGANDGFNKNLVKESTFDELFGFSYNEAGNASDLINLLYTNLGFDIDTSDAYVEDELSVLNRHDTYICNGTCSAVENIVISEGKEPIYKQCDFKMFWLPDGTPYPSSVSYIVCFQINDYEFKTYWGSIEIKVNNDSGINELSYAFETDEDAEELSDMNESECCGGTCSGGCTGCENGCDGCESCLEFGCGSACGNSDTDSCCGSCEDTKEDTCGCGCSGESCNSCSSCSASDTDLITDLIYLSPEDSETFEAYKETVSALPKNEWIYEDHYWYYLVNTEEEFNDIYFYKIFRTYPEIMKEFISTYDDVPDVFCVYCDRVDPTNTVLGIKICIDSEIERDRCPCGYYALCDEWN